MKSWLLLVAAVLLWPGSSSQNACEEPDEIDFGEIVSAEKAKYLENDRVQYRCNPGYVLEGPEWIQCKGQKWTPHPPKCLAPCSITRQQLATKNLFVFGSQRKARLIQSNHSLQFQCNEGYVIVVPSVRKCVDGYMELPLCISERGQNCSGPPRTENGDVTTLSEKQYKSGSSVEFKCQTYYAMEGQKRSFCDDGTWTKVPICLDPCVISRTELESQKIEVKDGIEVPDNIFVQRGLSIELTCRTGYVLEANSSQSTFVIQCDGTPPMIPKCKEITCNSPRISNGSFRPQRTLYHDGDLIRILCDSGFTFEPDNGEKVVECTRNGWSLSPKCVNAMCPTPPIVENAEIIEDTMKKYLNGEKINYQCNDGFDIHGSAAVTCRQNNWSRLPRCVDVRCSSPHRIQNGQIIGEIKAKYLPREKVQYRCYIGYALLGSPFITCSKNGWTETPRCTDIGGKCGRPPYVENGDIVDSPKLIYLHSESVIYQCQNYYTMQGSPRVTCQNGRWSQTPTCRAACSASEEDLREHNIRLKWDNGDKIYSQDGNVVEFVCLRNYIPHPDTRSFRVNCVDGKFNYPRCIPRTA
ncbi:complement factor H-related protein 1-like isoform X2 [Pantherophis guttatus]|uniref:Complement factor H-related protein 1-like isoform X2 n=1 Tax=Pantherophis guttatus TaxID=94885 RepID=A0ABM3ZDC6_PANGU|nr:complement factor H-related protein 1-like isoform X2 [Pantherophis guttatus]